ncbi:hypothetical protein EXIGLDRAFT_824837 [Exidia glandulosa HHB12029]|uniref:F-box domain-containing protein n=1 Tax=Exidia glandulosa HHB12029 TaxID=1314781 RepID=A0A165IWN0_EXIGL|nr:hypothetical protein EXIGLDRAFT_824837 [Exidia glandulosa HHB12029]
MIPIAASLARDTDSKTLARLARVSSSLLSLVSPSLYRTIFLHTPRAGQSFCHALASNPHLGAYVRVLSIRRPASGRLAVAPHDMLDSCVNLAVVQIMYMASPPGRGRTELVDLVDTIVPRLLASQRMTRLVVGESDEHPVEIIRRITNPGLQVDIERLTELYILRSSVTVGARILPPDFKVFQNLESLVIAMDVTPREWDHSLDSTVAGLRSLWPSLWYVRKLPRLKRLRFFLYPAHVARATARDFVASTREMDDRRITVAVIESAEEAESLVVLHELGRIDIWTHGEPLLEHSQHPAGTTDIVRTLRQHGRWNRMY